MDDVAKVDRPREKLQKRGVKALSDEELLQVVIGSGVSGADVKQISKNVLEKLDEGTDNITLDLLTSIKGLGAATATKILASLEIADRFVRDNAQRIQKPEDVLPLLSDIKDKKREHLVSITLDGANRVIARRTVSIGTLNASLIHPREVFADAVEDRAAGIILAHNHPSGDAKPSKEDKEITKKIQKAGELLGITLIDHMIVTADDCISI